MNDGMTRVDSAVTYTMTLSPDYNVKFLSGWFIFNTWLQKTLELRVHLEIIDDFQSQRRAIEAGAIDLIYANPYDAATLIREHGFMPVARPASRADEVIIATAAAASCQQVEDLKPGTRIASTDDPDVHMLGMILLEPADLNADNVAIERLANYVVVARQVLNGEADIGFFLAEMYNELSQVTRSRLRVVTQSHIHVVHHALLVGPRLAAHQQMLRDALLGMNVDTRTARILKDMGLKGWELLDDEAAAFMIDLMDTLV